MLTIEHGCINQPFYQDLASGKLTQLWKITIFNGKTHYNWGIFNSYVTNYQRVYTLSSHFSPLLTIKSPFIVVKSPFSYGFPMIPVSFFKHSLTRSNAACFETVPCLTYFPVAGRWSQEYQDAWEEDEGATETLTLRIHCTRWCYSSLMFVI